MLTIHKLIPQGQGLAAVLLKRAPTVELDWDTRQKSRFDATDSSGRHLGIFLPRGSVVRGGDVLLADDGSLVRVLAATQPVMQVRICPEHGQPLDLLRAAYHLGNRHVTLALAPDVLTLERDHVLAEMLDRMHLIVSETDAPFEPEAGAYAVGTTGSHAHGHEPGHAHDHAQRHEAGALTADARGKPVPVAVRSAPVAQGACGCGHDHGHEHGHEHTHDHGHDHGHPHDHPHRH